MTSSGLGSVRFAVTVALASGAGLLLASLFAFSASAQQRVGTAGAVNPDASANGRVLRIGSDINFKETITTSGQGTTQVIFADKTTLTIGPNSKVTIDEFVYNPSQGSGRMTINLLQGALRVVGGDVTHNGSAKVSTPVATVGIRGGVATISHRRTTTVHNHFGRITVTSGGRSESIYRSGFAVNVGGTGSSGQISAPARAPLTEVAAVSSALSSQQGQSGGLPRRPTEASIQAIPVGRESSTYNPSTLVSARGQVKGESAAVRQDAIHAAVGKGSSGSPGNSGEHHNSMKGKGHHHH